MSLSHILLKAFDIAEKILVKGSEILQNEKIKSMEAKEKYRKQGIEEWDEKRLCNELKIPLNCYERSIISQRLAEVRMNKFGIDKWDEHRLRKALEFTSNSDEQTVILKKLKELHKNDYYDLNDYKYYD